MAEIQLVPLETSDREQFIKDNQEAFNYGAMEEFGLRDAHFEDNDDEQIIPRKTQKPALHFYVNRCGFHIVEYFNEHHCAPDDKDGGLFDMFRFEIILPSTPEAVCLLQQRCLEA